jgi:hypothetical protein
MKHSRDFHIYVLEDLSPRDRAFAAPNGLEMADFARVRLFSWYSERPGQTCAYAPLAPEPSG